MINLATEFAKRGLQVKRRDGEPDEIWVCCPFCVDKGHRPDQRFRLGVNLSTGKAHCFNCDYSSRKGLIDLLRKMGSSAMDLHISMDDFANVTNKKPSKVILPFGFEKLEDVDENDGVLGQARRYVKKRGISLRQLHEHEIGATVADDLYRYRVIFPIRRDKRLVGLVARDWTGTKDKKFINSSGNKSVYNADPAKYGTKMVVVSEGVVKALAIERAFTYKVCSAALLGNRMSSEQEPQLAEFEEVVLFPDPDKAGMDGFLSVAAKLETVVKKVSMAWPWPKQQADDMEAEEILEAVKNRKEVTPLLRMRIRSEIGARG
jgi:hypothetical protein